MPVPDSDLFSTEQHQPPAHHDWTQVTTLKRAAIAAALGPYALPRSSLPPPDQLDVSSFIATSRCLTRREHELTGEASLPKALKQLHSGAWSSTELVLAYIKRATIAHQLCNAITEPNFAAAIARAKFLDYTLKSTGKVVGPLHGVPITLKDQFNVPGLDTTITYTARAFQPKNEAAVLVAALEELGAVVIAKTTLPQSIMWCETESPMFGLTTHPKNRSYTPGGSSGGEAVLLSLDASLVGFGTDIGGSIRIPAAMCGLYGFKPTSSRLPYTGVDVSTQGQEHVPSSIGPMARHMHTIFRILKTLLGPQASVRLSDLDPRVTPTPWITNPFETRLASGQRLKIGIFADDTVVRPHPPITRLLSRVAEKLSAAGHICVPWRPGPLHTTGIAIVDQFYRSDGGADVRDAVSAGGEPFLPHVDALVHRAPEISVSQYWQLNRRKWELQNRYHKFWVDSGVDFVVSPVMPHCAVPHRACGWVGYTKIWNVLDYPAGVVPVGMVEKADREAPYPECREGGYGRFVDEEVVRNGIEREALDRRNWRLWDPEAMVGLPVALQVVAGRWKDEVAVAGMMVLDEVMNGRW